MNSFSTEFHRMRYGSRRLGRVFSTTICEQLEVWFRRRLSERSKHSRQPGAFPRTRSAWRPAIATCVNHRRATGRQSNIYADCELNRADLRTSNRT